MLMSPDQILILYMFEQGFQDHLLHQIPKDQGEADQPVVPCILLLALLEDRSDIWLLPILRNLF